MASLTLLVALRLLSAAPAPVGPPEAPAAEKVRAETPAAAAADDGDDADDAPDSPDSDELEQMRALEEVALDPSATPSAAVLRSVGRLGIGNPLRGRIEDDADGQGLFDDSPIALGPVTDVLNFDCAKVAGDYDIPVEMQPLVAEYIRFFQGPGRKWFRKWMSRSSRYIPVMAPLLEREGVPRDTVYLSMIESGFSPEAYSWARASGPWQFIAATGKRYGLKQDFWVDERRDFIKSTLAAAHYLKRLRDDLGHWYLAWAGYNAGAERVRRVMAKKGTSDFWELSDGRGLAKETRHYVPKLIAAALVAKHPAAFGFSDAEFEYEKPLPFEEVKLVDPTDLDVIAKAAGVPTEEVKALNPELKRWCTPPATAEHPYTLRLPSGTRTAFEENYAKLAPKERLTFKVHRVRKGDTLSQIARHYHSAPEAILQLNRMRNGRLLRINSDLVIPVAPGSSTPADEAELPSALQHRAAKARRSGFVALRPEEEVPAGTPRALAHGPIKSELVDGKQRLSYAVVSGDTLWSIGQQFNCSVDDLKRWNRLGRKGRLQVGAVLTVWPGQKVPLENRGGTLVAQKPSDEGTPASRRTHLLAAGETLWSVAQHYGVTVEDLKRWNNIRHDKALRPGQELVLSAP